MLKKTTTKNVSVLKKKKKKYTKTKKKLNYKSNSPTTNPPAVPGFFFFFFSSKDVLDDSWQIRDANIKWKSKISLVTFGPISPTWFQVFKNHAEVTLECLHFPQLATKNGSKNSEQVISKIAQESRDFTRSYQTTESSLRPFLSHNGVDANSTHCSFHHLPVSFLEMHPSQIQRCGWFRSSGTRKRTPGAWTYHRSKLCDTRPQILQEERELDPVVSQGWLKQQHVCSPRFRGWKLKI